MDCHARLRFDRSEVSTSRNDHRDSGRYEVECNQQSIYDDSLRIFVRTDDQDHGGNDQRDHDVIFSGRGAQTPRIYVRDLRIGQDGDGHGDNHGNGRDHGGYYNDDSRAHLTLWNAGYMYDMEGRCSFERDENSDHGGSSPVPTLN